MWKLYILKQLCWYRRFLFVSLSPHSCLSSPLTPPPHSPVPPSCPLVPVPRLPQARVFYLAFSFSLYLCLALSFSLCLYLALVLSPSRSLSHALSLSLSHSLALSLARSAVGCCCSAVASYLWLWTLGLDVGLWVTTINRFHLFTRRFQQVLACVGWSGE